MLALGILRGLPRGSGQDGDDHLKTISGLRLFFFNGLLFHLAVSTDLGLRFRVLSLECKGLGTASVKEQCQLQLPLLGGHGAANSCSLFDLSACQLLCLLMHARTSVLQTLAFRVLHPPFLRANKKAPSTAEYFSSF